MSKEEKDQFGSRIKGYESSFEQYLDKTKYTIVRIDGHGFSKFTKGFQKPFDGLLTTIMSETARSLMEEFKAVVAYSQSDEITLILKPDNNLIYSGRIQKLTSLMASFTSMKFNELVREEHILELKKDVFNTEQNPRRQLLKSKLGKAFFDARVFQVPSEVEAFNSLLWRVHDCKKNSISVYAQSICSHKELQNKNGQDMIKLCREKGHDYSLLDNKYKYGIFWKKESYVKQVTEDDTGGNDDTCNFNAGQTCIRTRFKSFSIDLQYSEAALQIILCDKLTDLSLTDL